MAAPIAAVVAMAVVLGVFVARPLLSGPWLALAPFGLLLVVGLGWPVVADGAHGPVAITLVVGLGAFLLGRLVGGGHVHLNLNGPYLPEVVVAAVAEEAFFRRFVFAVLLPAGPGIAVFGSAALFAVAHVTVYGWWVLPVDLAAGLVLSWVRWYSGRWVASAATHVVANLLIVL